MEKAFALEEFRKQREAFFRSSPQSPIPNFDKYRFKGLDFYPYNSSMEFELEVVEYAEKETIETSDTHGGTQKYIRWGYIEFDIESTKCRLTLYKQTADTQHLWMPFKDLTNGFDTFGAGRYLDLYDNKHKLESGLWLVDFNKAYTPFCAYNDKYICPYIPPENHLKVSIRAGERNYFKPRHH